MLAGLVSGFYEPRCGRRLI